MPRVLKFLQMFNSTSGYGWSEVHYRLSGSDNPDLKVQLDTFLLNVGLPRAQMLGEDCYGVGMRVSYKRDLVIASKPNREFLPGQVGQPGAAPSASLAVNMADSTNTRSKIIHLRGFWDSVEENERYVPARPEAAGWIDRFNAWKQALIAGQYGWLAKTAADSAKGKALSYVVANNGIVTFTLEGPGMPEAVVGTQQQVRFSKFNKSNSLLNKTILVNVDTRTSLTSVNPHAAQIMTSSGRYNFRGTGFVPYNDVSSVVLGERRMGKPLNRSPGRSKARPTT